MKRGKWRPFEEARKFVRSLGLKNQVEWREYYKSGNKPDDIPSRPDKAYNGIGWKNLGDWLGTGRIASRNRKYRSFDKARKFVRKLGLKSYDDWSKYRKSSKRPKDIPAQLNIIYHGKGWDGYGDFLGTGRIASQKKYLLFWSFKKTRAFVQKLRLKGQKDFENWCRAGKRPEFITTHPSRSFKNNGWEGWGDFLGTGRVANKNMKFWSFKKARVYVRSLSFKDQTEFRNAAKSGKLPTGIPRAPVHEYEGKEWKSWGDWLGTGTIANQNRNLLPPIKAKIEARKLQKKLGIKTHREWIKAYKAGKIPSNLPSDPYGAYGNKGRIKK